MGLSLISFTVVRRLTLYFRLWIMSSGMDIQLIRNIWIQGDVEGIRTLLKAIRGDEEVDATTIATVGESE